MARSMRETNPEQALDAPTGISRVEGQNRSGQGLRLVATSLGPGRLAFGSVAVPVWSQPGSNPLR